ncbi:peptidase M23 [Bacterioplanes sanyensis]|uniref:Peptidase M23 n=1 Tax=Bacterioplanes sanyensis TaxID=1249553 RepID=A0A222FJ48_9GAMM|nr:peptidoglycan DD-metalloendopeptidase family protein [Bacterioplanes sanyensis]ASP38769.1 peptidase M23 [Bacterioplanes sanyensis]
MNKSVTVILVTIITLATGCTANREFVSVEEKFGGRQKASGFHIVEAGDTLYSIAWRHGIDFRELASANSISSPYTIHPGQKIDLKAKPVVSSPRPTADVGKPSTRPVTIPVRKPSPAEIGQNPPKIVVKSGQPEWQWPLNGRLIRQFSMKKPINKGIDITAPLGDSVLAAAAGTVVYAGRGLRGYGNLVIVKHDDTYLSAYAHASRILVSEQEMVKAGQKIAEIGSTGTDSVRLHFEIRKNGKPVDPLKYLPPR